ncbi:MAG: hypothetical protein GY711_27870 [bacterium]|nr:hypothetical protein [bacterium]
MLALTFSVALAAQTPSVAPPDFAFIVTASPHYGSTEAVHESHATALRGVAASSRKLRGVVVVGDLAVDAETGWPAFAKDHTLSEGGAAGVPTYEGYGDRDGETTQARVAERNLARPGLRAVSRNGLHYSWDWEDVHCVHLNLYPGEADSLEFLRRDLANNVGESGRPVVLFHHLGLYDRTGPDVAPRGWSREERAAYFEALRPYQVAAIFHAAFRDDDAPGAAAYFWDEREWAGESGIERTLPAFAASGHAILVRVEGEQLKATVHGSHGTLGNLRSLPIVRGPIPPPPHTAPPSEEPFLTFALKAGYPGPGGLGPHGPILRMWEDGTVTHALDPTDPGEGQRIGLVGEEGVERFRGELRKLGLMGEKRVFSVAMHSSYETLEVRLGKQTWDHALTYPRGRGQKAELTRLWAALHAKVAGVLPPTSLPFDQR